MAGTEASAGTIATGLTTSDPTPLTTAQIIREITALRELIFTRLDAMDEALKLFHENITRVPTDTDKQIQHLRELQDEKFKRIELQFLERDTRAEQSALDNRVRVDAAFASAKEATAEQNKSNALSIAKTEDGINKQLTQMALLIEKAMDSPRIEISALKERITLSEGKGFGVVASQQGHQTSSSFMVALVVAAAAVAGLIMKALR